MKKSFLNRIKTIESQSTERQVNDPVTFFDNESGFRMQVIGKGLVVPLLIEYEKNWEAIAVKYYGKNFKTRIEVLEDKLIYQKGLPPGLVYISGLPNSKTLEEAKAAYKQKHGFELPEDALIIHIVAFDGRKYENKISKHR